MKLCLLPVAIVFLAACSASDPPASSTAATTSALACDNTALESTCADFGAGQTKAYAGTHCDGKVVAGPCPSAHSVGTCTVTANGETLKNTYYDDGPTPHTVENAKTACDGFQGTFAAAH